MKLFDPPCRNTEICPPWKSCLECEWRVCVSSTDALVTFISPVFLVNLAYSFRRCHAAVPTNSTTGRVLSSDVQCGVMVVINVCIYPAYKHHVVVE